MSFQNYIGLASYVDGKVVDGKRAEVNWNVVHGPDHGYFHSREVVRAITKASARVALDKNRGLPYPKLVVESINDDDDCVFTSALTSAVVHDCGLWVGSRETHHNDGADLIEACRDVFDTIFEVAYEYNFDDVVQSIRDHRRPLEDLEESPVSWLVCYGDKITLTEAPRAMVRCVASRLTHQEGVPITDTATAMTYAYNKEFIEECVDHVYRKVNSNRVLGNRHIAEIVESIPYADAFWHRPESTVREDLKKFAVEALNSFKPAYPEPKTNGQDI